MHSRFHTAPRYVDQNTVDGPMFHAALIAVHVPRRRRQLFQQRHKAERNLPLFVHGSGMPRSEMIRRFKESTNAVLFGTDSFWQGVDVPGESLRNVIITKLPFLVPNQPVVEAKIEAIQSRGGVPFREFQLPQAILKFKQGFGRLIRTKTDTGLVVVLDTRIQTQSYGRQFIESLPKCTIRVDNASEPQR